MDKRKIWHVTGDEYVHAVKASDYDQLIDEVLQLVVAKSRIAQLEAALRSAKYRMEPLMCRDWLMEEIDALLAPQSETSVEPVAGAGQLCRLCGNVHDLMSACPPLKTGAKP